MKRKNLAAKHARKFNKATVFTDRKKALKMGKQKHKSRSIDRLFDIYIPPVFLMPQDNQ